jgi:transposase
MPICVSVSSSDRAALHQLLKAGVRPVRVVLRGLALLHLADGMTVRETARALKKLTAKTVRSVARNYRECGLDRALYEKPRPGAEQLLSPAEKQSILAMVSGDPPDGRARWTVRLIVEEAVNRKVVSQVGRETIRVLLKDHGLKPWRQKRVNGWSTLKKTNLFMRS